MDQIYIVLVLLVIITPSMGKRLSVKWNSFDCIVNGKVVVSHKCFIVEPANNLITAEIEYSQVFESYNAQFVFYMPRPPFQEYHKTIDFKIDICEFFRGSNKNVYVKTAYKAMTRFSNLPKKCPQPKGFYYYHNMSIGDNLPQFLPKCEFKIQLDFYMPNVPILNVTLMGRIVSVLKPRG